MLYYYVPGESHWITGGIVLRTTKLKENHRTKQRDKNTGVMSRVGRFIIGKRTNNIKFALERKP